jgi:5-methylcytosine-specific restriction endonuclease McrA
LADGLALEEMKWVKPSTKPKPKVLSTYSARTTLRTRRNRRRKTSPKDRIRGLRSLKSLGNTHTKSIIRHIATVEGVRQYGGNIGDVIRLDENPVALRKPSSSGPAKKPKKLITKPGATIAEDTATPSMVSQLTISDGPKGKISDQIAPMEIFQQARETAIARAKASRTPNIEMISDNKARILEDPQLRSAGTDLRGNREQELRRSWSLFVTYGGLNNGDDKDGWIPCIYCAKKLSWYSKGADGSYAPYDKLEQDKVIPTKYGGKYVTHNLVPACRQCNASRGNKAFHEGQGLEGGKPDFWTDEWLASLDRIPPERSPQRGLYEGNERPMVPFPEAYLPKNRRKLQLQGAA